MSDNNKFQNFFSFVSSKNVHYKLNEIIIYLTVLYGCESWPLVPKHEYKANLKTAC